MKRGAVGFVADSNAGALLLELATRMHVWVVDTPENKTVARLFWNQHPNPSLATGITTFTSVGSSAEEDLINQLITIEEHHPGFNCLEVYGVSLSLRIKKSLEEAGFNSFTTIRPGFKAEK